MKNKLLSLCSATALVFLSSCAAGPETQTGAVLGGLAGAGLGGIIGHQSGRGLEGAAIGGAVGAVGGGVLGNAQDQRNARRYYGPPPQAYPPYQRW